MAIPTVPERRLMAAGLRATTAWGTPLALGAGHGCLLESDGGLTRAQPYLPAAEADTAFVREGDLGPHEPVSFAPEFSMRYSPGGLGIGIAQLFGIAGVPGNQGSGVYEHTFQWADEVYGLMCCYAEEKLSKVFEVDSAKVVSLDFTVSDGILKGALGMIGRRVTDNSSVNAAAQMDAITYHDRGNRVKFSTMALTMNDQTGGDVGAESTLEVSDLTVHYERPHDSIHKGGSDFIIEPAENAHPIVTVELTFPRMNAVNNVFFTTDFIAEVEKKMRIWFTGALIGGGLYNQLKLWFPRLRVTAIDYPWDEVVPGSMTLQSEEAASAPTAMAYARPYLILQNGLSTDYLA